MASPRERRRQMIGVSFGPRDMAEAMRGLSRIADEADVVELRLDFFVESYDLPTLLHERPCPVVVTLRPLDQGGKCADPADVRVKVLRQAAELGAEYVDVEWDAATPERIQALKAAGAQVLVSRHSFESMPRDFAERWWPEMVERGADVVKIVGMAESVRDCLPVFRAFKRADRPTVAIAMGEAGLPTRVLALREAQCFLSYATLGSGERVAPGQLPIREMREVYRVGQITPRTRILGLLAPRADAELAARYNATFTAAGVDAVAVPFLDDTAAIDTIRAFRELPVAGWHVSGERSQQAVASALDAIGPAARRLSKVNTIAVRADGSLVGDWLTSLDDQRSLWERPGADT